MATVDANVWYFCRRLPGAAAGRDRHGPLWRPAGTQEDVHPEHLHDGRADPDHGPAADLRTDRHVGADPAVADAGDPGRGDWW
ncbi:hypothetical protein D3C77_636060 [compost metagenome]